MINSVTLMGRLTADPILKMTISGIEFCRFSIAVERNYVSGGGKITDFIPVKVWQSKGKFICDHFKKGQMIALTGRIETGAFTDDEGNRRSTFEIIAEEVSFCGAPSAEKEHTPTNVRETKGRVRPQVEGYYKNTSAREFMEYCEEAEEDEY